MKRYQIMLTPDLEKTYITIAEHLEMSVEQVLSSVVHIYAEAITYQTFESVSDVERVRNYEGRRRKGLGNDR